MGILKHMNQLWNIFRAHKSSYSGCRASVMHLTYFYQKQYKSRCLYVLWIYIIEHCI